MATTEEEVTSYATEASGSTTTVNEAAKILVHATKTGDNLDTASRNLPLIPTTLKTFDIYNDPTQPAPLLNDYISSHPVRQKAVERDIPNYSYTERTMGKLSSLWGKTTKSMEQQRLALSIADYRHGNLAGKFLPDQERIKDDLELASAQARYDALGSELKDLTKYDTGEDDITDIGLGVAQLGIQMLGAPVANPKVAATAAGAAIAGSVTVSPLTAGASLLAAAPAGGIAAITAGSVEDNFRVTAGQIYQQAYLDNPRKAFIDDKEAYTIALGAAAASSGLEYLQVGGLLNKVPGIKSVTRKGVIEALKRGERGTAILVAAKLAGEAIKSGAQELGQQVIQDVATQTAEGRDQEKGLGEKILIASTSREAIQSFAIGAVAVPVIHVVTSKARTAYGHIVEFNEKLGEAGAVDTGDGGGEKPKEPTKAYRFIIQDADVKKAAQAEKTAQFISQVAATPYNESNPDLVETVERSISPEGYGYIHTDEMSQLTAQDQKLLAKWNSFTGDMQSGVKVVRIANNDVVALQRINKDVANIYRVKPNEPSVKSHQAWMEKIEVNRERVNQVMQGLSAVNKDVSQLTEAEVVHRAAPEPPPQNVTSFNVTKTDDTISKLQNRIERLKTDPDYQEEFITKKWNRADELLDLREDLSKPENVFKKAQIQEEIDELMEEAVDNLGAYVDQLEIRLAFENTKKAYQAKNFEDLAQKQLTEATSKPEDFSPIPVNLELPQANTLNAVNDTLQAGLDQALESNDDATINAMTNRLRQHIVTQEIPAVENSKLKSDFKTLDLNFTKRKLTEILVNAKQVILNTKISQLDPRQFAENARQYGKEASLALQNNDPVAYAQAKQLQLTNLQAIAELRKVKAGLDNFSQTIATLSDPEVLRKLRTLNDKHADFIENITSLFMTGEKARLDRDKYEASVKELQDANLPTVEVPEAMFNAIGVDPRELSVNQLQAVDAALKTAQSAAQNELKMFRLEEAKELNEVVEQFKVRLGTRKDANPENYVKVQSMLEETNLTKLKQVLAKNNPVGFIKSAINAIFNNVADITRYDLDLGENNGYFTRTIYNPLIAASNEKSQLTKTFNDVIADVINLYGVKEWSRLERNKINFLGKDLSQAELIVMSSYLGTESSQKRLAQWLKAKIPDITAELEKYVSHKDVANMQKIVNFYSGVVLPKERALNQRMAIPPLKEIDALPFTFDGKTFKGGYLPLNTMADFMTKANREGTSYVENVRAGKLKADIQTHDRTFDVHELNREGSDLPIDLTLTGIRDSFDMRAHDLAYRETAHDLTKILTNKDNQRYLVGVLGIDKYAHLHDAIQTIIGNRYNSEVQTEGKLRKLYGDIGTNAVFAALGGNINTLFKQTQSMPLMIGELAQASGNGAVVSTLSSTRHLLAAAADVLTNPVTWYQQAEFIAKMDADFADKFKKWNRDNPDFLRLAKSFDPSLDQIQDHRKWMITRGWQSFRSMSLAPLSMVSLYLNTIQWTAAYNMAMNGEVKNVKPTQTEAALHATKAVRFALERNETFEKSDIQKLWYMRPFTFMTNQASVQGAAVLGQFNVANRMGKIDPATRKYMYTKAFAKGFMTVAVPSMIIKLLLGRATKEKDEETGEQVLTQEYEKLINNPKTWIAKNAAWSLADTVPIVSSMSYMIQGNLEYGNPITDIGVGAAATFRSGAALMVGDEPTKEEVRKSRKFLFGSLLGVPFQKIQTAIFDAAYKTYKESSEQSDPLYDTSHNAAIEDNPTPSPLLYQAFWAATGLLYQFGKPQMMDAGSESAEDIIDGMKEDSANNRSNPGLQMARSAEIRTSQRGYLMNPEYKTFTRYFDNGNTDTLSLTADEEKDWEIYLDVIGRKETGNYTKLKNPESSASGYLQILDGTVNNLANLYPHFSEYKGKSAIDLPTDIQFAMGRTLFGERYPDLKQVEVESQVDRFTLWYLASHVLPPISGDRILKAYSEGKMTKQISYLISKAELDSNPVLFGKASDKLTLEKVLDRVKNGYEFKGKTIKGIRDYLEMAQEDADKGIGKLK